MRKLHANLMGSARMQANSDKAMDAKFGVFRAAYHLVIKDRLLDTAPLAIDHKGFVAGAVVKEQVAEGIGGGLRLTVHQRKIFLLELMQLHIEVQ